MLSARVDTREEKGTVSAHTGPAMQTRRRGCHRGNSENRAENHEGPAQEYTIQLNCQGGSQVGTLIRVRAVSLKRSVVKDHFCINFQSIANQQGILLPMAVAQPVLCPTHHVTRPERSVPVHTLTRGPHAWVFL